MFTLDGIIFEEVLSVIAESISTGKMLYRLPQVSDCTIDVTADSVDSVDKYGSLIKRVYRSKTAEITMTNAHLDLNAYAAMAGVDKEVASEDNTITVPKTVRVASTEESVVLDDMPVDGTLQVSAVRNTGSLGDSYDLGSEASETEFGWDESSQTVTFPTLSDDDKEDVAEFLVKYDYEASAAVRVMQTSKDFPKTVKLIINALGYDPCEPDVLQFFRITFPSFQPSPECTIDMATDATFDYTGEAQTDYCSTNKILFEITCAEGDVEDNSEEE